ncbi:MAG: class B sortase [Lachnospiraceae bacterium]|nr:class B sortase [Lachnospiraceae bacterium]
MADHTEYGTGYDPNALEHDLQLISRLMRGKRKLTSRLANDIYYKIKSENLTFQSSRGEEFYDKILKNTTEAQRRKTQRQIAAGRRRRQNARRILNINRNIAVVMFALVFLISAVYLNWNFLMDVRTNYHAKKLLERIGEGTDAAAAEAATDGEDDSLMTPDSGEESGDASEQSEPRILSKFQALYDENNDFSGWLSIEGTKINYPVMSREGDNDYYLDKNFNGQEDKNGLLILDYRSDVLESGQNIIIYGHNMRTGVMFGTLKEYKDKDYCMEHQTIRFDSLYSEGEYKVAAVMLSAVAYEDEDVFRYYDAIDISTQELFDEFCRNIEENALYTTDVSLEFGDSCLILSTCDYYTEDGRFVVIAKKTNTLRNGD